MKVGYADKFNYSYFVLSNAGFDKKFTMFFIYLFDWFKNCERNDEK